VQVDPATLQPIDRTASAPPLDLSELAVSAAAAATGRENAAIHMSQQKRAHPPRMLQRDALRHAPA
jgi:hypothetical protein